MRLFFNMELCDLKGFGPKRLKLLEQVHIESINDLIRYFPVEYFNRSEVVPIAEAEEGKTVTLCVRTISDASLVFYRGKTMVSQRVCDDSGKLTIRWINQPYRANQYGIGTILYLKGKITRKRGVYLYNPRIEQQADEIIPIYDLPKGLTQSSFRNAVAEAFDSDPWIDETIPDAVLQCNNLLSLSDALYQIHFPSDAKQLFCARYRVQFDRAFQYFLALESFRESDRLQIGFAFKAFDALEPFVRDLPFRPTDAQMRVLHEVASDMESPVPMNRLIQGDVGSGKTVIAAFALSVAVKAEKQGVLLAPTEILAEQHFRKLSAMFGCGTVLYTGSLTAKEKNAALQMIENGTAKVIIGTHALLSDNVRFCDLGVVVADEQHRFGVEQRAKIVAKGIRPDVLVMSATPIPRTLALLLYSDLSLSLIDALPQGRKPIQTHYVPFARRKAMYQYIAERVRDYDERAYVVCPLIVPTEGYESLSAEELYTELSESLQNCPVGLLHGRMKDAQKNAIMESFAKGEVRILVSTTVVEVGVDVPEATFMVVEGADHFGLATLHQLRGRVGRSERPSVCYLLSEKLSEHAQERIRTMLRTNDGFSIAQKDLELRGFGDLFGVRQSGEGSFSSLLEDCTIELLERAAKAAKDVLNTPSLHNNELISGALERYTRQSNIARN